jgi:halimadienyl-diphosphate synthase
MKAWSLHSFDVGGLSSRVARHCAAPASSLARAWTPKGIGGSTVRGQLPDADDTAVGLLVLGRRGYAVDAKALRAYRAGDCYATYAHEAQASTSTNLHVLEALDALPDAAGFDRGAVVRWLLDRREAGSHWRDKWHVSRFYATALAIAVLGRSEAAELRRSIRWVLDAQREDGSWGDLGGTQDETAMCLLGLLIARDGGLLAGRDERALHRAFRYLLERRDAADDHPELWLAKVLYAPLPVIRAVILSALWRYLQTFAHA